MLTGWKLQWGRPNAKLIEPNLWRKTRAPAPNLIYAATVEGLLAKIARRPIVAFVAAALKRALPIVKCEPDVEHLLYPMIVELRVWQDAAPWSSTRVRSDAAVMKLPSAKFYYVYQSRLRGLAASKYRRSLQVHHLLCAAISLISFVVWLMHRHELTLYPWKPAVLGSDVADVDWETLSIGLETLVAASPDPGAALAWQRETISKLATDYPASRDPTDFGQRLEWDHFEG